MSATSYGAINTCRVVWELRDYIISLSMDVCGLVLIVILLKSVVVTVCVAGCHMALLIWSMLNWYISMTRYGYGVRDWLSYGTMDVRRLVHIVTAQIKSFWTYCFGWQVMAFELFRPSFDYGVCGWLWHYRCTFSGYSIYVYMSYWLWHGAAVSSHLRTLNQQVWFDGLWEIDLRERDTQREQQQNENKKWTRIFSFDSRQYFYSLNQ